MLVQEELLKRSVAEFCQTVKTLEENNISKDTLATFLELAIPMIQSLSDEWGELERYFNGIEVFYQLNKIFCSGHIQLSGAGFQPYS